MANDDTDDGLLDRLRAVDRRVSGWGFRVSGWTGVFVGVIAMTVVEEAVQELTVPEVYAPVLLLAVVYALLGVAAALGERYGGLRCVRVGR